MSNNRRFLHNLANHRFIETDGYDPTYEDFKQLTRKKTMTLQETLTRYQDHINAGHLDPNMPAFLLIACDIVAPAAIRQWGYQANEAGTPFDKVQGAYDTANAFEAWPAKQVPGRPETRTTK